MHFSLTPYKEKPALQYALYTENMSYVNPDLYNFMLCVVNEWIITCP